MTAVVPSAAAIVLVGGRGRRMCGAVKPLLMIGGETLLARTLRALDRAGAAPVYAVGPVLDAAAEVRWVREDPPLGGPAAGVAAAVPGIAEEWVYVLAGDLVHPDRVVARLTSARLESADDGESGDGWVFTAGGHPQWLAGLYRTAAVRAALVGLSSASGSSMRGLLGGLALARLDDEDGITADIDEPADLARAGGEEEETR